MRKPKPGHDLRVACRAESLCLRLLLELRGIRPKAIAASLGVSAANVSHVLAGTIHLASVEAEIARILGVPNWNSAVAEARWLVEGIAGVNEIPLTPGGAA